MGLRRRELRLESGIRRLGFQAGLNNVSGLPFNVASFYIDTVNGSDSNPGTSPGVGGAWQTWSKLAAQIGSMPAGDWYTNTGAKADISTLPNSAAVLGWNQASIAGQRVHSGARIVISAPSNSPLLVTSLLTLGKRQLVSAVTNTKQWLTSIAALPASGWVQVDSASFPEIWKYNTTALKFAVPYELSGANRIQLAAIGANGTPVLTLTAAKSAMGRGSFYVDPADNKLCVRSIAGGNPNSDGISRVYQTNLIGTMEGYIIECSGGLVQDFICDGGFLFDGAAQQTSGSASAPVGQDFVGTGDQAQLSVIRRVQFRYYGKHGCAATGSPGNGTTLRDNVTYALGPGGIPAGNWSSSVDAYVGLHHAVQMSNHCNSTMGVANVGTAGGSSSTGAALDGSYNSRISHGDGVNPSTDMLVFQNCQFDANVSVGAIETLLATVTNTAATALFSDVTTLQVTNSTFSQRLPILGASRTSGTSGTFGDCTFSPNTAYGGAQAGISGTYAFNNCAFDFSSGNTAASAWTKAGTYNLSFSGGFINLVNWVGANTALLSAFTVGTDILTMSGMDFEGPIGLPAVLNYNGTGNPQSFYDLFASGQATSCTRNGVAIVAPSPPASIAASDILEYMDFVSTQEAWQDLLFMAKASNPTDPVRAVAGSYYGSLIAVPSDGQRPLRNAGGLTFDAVDDGAGIITSRKALLVGSTGYAIVMQEKLTGTTTTQARRTIQSENQANRIMSLTRGDGNAFYGGSGVISAFRIAPDGLYHLAILNVPFGGNYAIWVDGVNKTTGSIGASDWGNVCFGVGYTGLAAAETADTTLARVMLLSRSLTGTEITNLTTYFQGLPQP
jgi:hypothetical protein